MTFSFGLLLLSPHSTELPLLEQLSLFTISISVAAGLMLLMYCKRSWFASLNMAVTFQANVSVVTHQHTLKLKPSSLQLFCWFPSDGQLHHPSEIAWSFTLIARTCCLSCTVISHHVIINWTLFDSYDYMGPKSASSGWDKTHLPILPSLLVAFTNTCGGKPDKTHVP